CAVRAGRRLRRVVPPACGGPGPVPPRARGGRYRRGRQRHPRAAPARRLLPRPPAVRRMAQAPRPVALLHQVRSPPPLAPHPRGGAARARRLFVEWPRHRGLSRYFTKCEAPRRSLPTRAAVFLAIWLHFPFAVARRFF